MPIIRSVGDPETGANHLLEGSSLNKTKTEDSWRNSNGASKAFKRVIRLSYFRGNHSQVKVESRTAYEILTMSSSILVHPTSIIPFVIEIATIRQVSGLAFRRWVPFLFGIVLRLPGIQR